METEVQLSFLGSVDWPGVVVLVLVILIILGARKLPELFRGLGSGVEEFWRATRDVHRDAQRIAGMEPMEPEQSTAQLGIMTRALVIWLAQGFGVGRIPWAPGTFGSVLGLGWFAILLLVAQWSPVSAGVIYLGSVLASVWTCEAAEILLGEKDPGSIVLDEIVALPTCFLGWVFYLWLQLGELPSVEFFFGVKTCFLALGTFLAFRFFDIAKPWPIKQSQAWSHGWGVVMDDQLAAVYVNVVVLLVHVGLQLAQRSG